MWMHSQSVGCRSATKTRSLIIFVENVSTTAYARKPWSARQGVQLREDEGLLQKLRRPGSTVAGATADNQPKIWMWMVGADRGEGVAGAKPKPRAEDQKQEPGQKGETTRARPESQGQAPTKCQPNRVCDLTG